MRYHVPTPYRWNMQHVPALRLLAAASQFELATEGKSELSILPEVKMLPVQLVAGLFQGPTLHVACACAERQRQTKTRSAINIEINL